MLSDQPLWTKTIPMLLDSQPLQITTRIAHAQSGRGLEIRLTCDSDAFLLHRLSIDEDAFHIIKQAQDLLIDFAQFSSKFIELLEACSISSPKFTAHLRQENARLATLSILESNSFKQIVHLTLAFVPGTDVAIKEYLATVAKALKTQLDATSHQLQQTQEQSNRETQRLTIELDRMRTLNTDASTDLHHKYQDDISSEREKRAKERETQMLAFDIEKRNIGLQFEEEIKGLRTSVTTLTTTNSHLHSQIQTLDIQSSNYSKRVDALSSDLFAMKADAEKSSASLKSSEKENYQLIQECAGLKQLNRTCESKAAQSNEANIRLEAELGNLKAIHEKSTDALKQDILDIEEALGIAKDEINKVEYILELINKKGNEIIRKLQSDLKTSKLKAKSKNTLVLQQEKLLEERAFVLDTLQKDVTEGKAVFEKQFAELGELRATVEKLRKTVDEKTEIIHDNTNVIEWLHRQLNDQTLAKPVDATYQPKYEKFTSQSTVRSVDAVDVQNKSPLRPIESIKQDAPVMKSKFASSVAQSGSLRGLGTRMPLKPAQPTAVSMFSATQKSNYF